MTLPASKQPAPIQSPQSYNININNNNNTSIKQSKRFCSGYLKTFKMYKAVIMLPIAQLLTLQLILMMSSYVNAQGE